ncbi:MAG: hypothetical protein WAZ12_03670 [Candidatus Absconditicoccaceae bacterium]
MIEKIKSELFKKYKNDDIKGMFFSLFDEKNNLLFSNGVLKTDKTMDKLIDTLYYGLMDKISGIKTVVVDVVLSYDQETDLQKLLGYDVKQYGFCLISANDQKTGAVLPDTKGISDAKQALGYIKQKNGISGNLEIYSFKTDRIVLSI